MLEDIQQVVTDPDAIAVIDALLVYNGIVRRGDIEILQKLELVSSSYEGM